MRRIFLLILLAIPALAHAQAPTGQSPAGQAPAAAPPAPRAGPEARKAELDRAFEALRTAPDEAGAALVEGR
ncbi:MAG: tetratricopeptide repeat protein, partial [Belnapia sp.]|nr:tetratricopeptide repeat protein [Belnapia sp.]